MTTVFTSHKARRFHQTPACHARIKAQDLNDWDCSCGDYCTHHSPRLWPVREVPLDEAFAAGKKPCDTCYKTPSQRHTTLPPSTDDFGHKPIDIGGASICARCTHPNRASRYVFWPCTSAIVLGLAPRPQETAQ